jgi:hypothetical protein
MWDAAGFMIDGNSNFGMVTQFGEDHSAVLSVQGNNNSALINQSNGMGFDGPINPVVPGDNIQGQ